MPPGYANWGWLTEEYCYIYIKKSIKIKYTFNLRTKDIVFFIITYIHSYNKNYIENNIYI
jgi:hypothetical protein